ncbi:MAG: hypothetical protein KAS85_00280 [Rhodobacteraceae bacterium]|nr:hypothetical protein [Paracoccaceae bacterium]
MRVLFIITFSLIAIQTNRAASQASPLASFFENLDLDEGFHHDADIMRYSNLVNWAVMIEEYHDKTGYYPMSKVIEEDRAGGLVRIAKQEHAQYFYQDSPNYNYLLDFNQNYHFQNIHPISLIWVLEKKLDRDIEERYDIQSVPVHIPTWLHYFVMPDGYVLWTACDLCEASEITITVGNEHPYQTINIASSEIAATRSDFFTLDELLNHPTFRALLLTPPHKPDYLVYKLDENLNHWRDIYKESEATSSSESTNVNP